MHAVQTTIHKCLVIALLLVSSSSLVLAQDSEPELDRESPIPLDPAAGEEIGFIYQAYLSPEQQGDEEAAAPRFIPDQFRSTAPSVPRSERDSRGHAVLEFTRDLSRAYVHLAVENVDHEEIVLLHLHCGRPGQLGPILVDFEIKGDVSEFLADGVLTLEITNEDIAETAAMGGDILGAFTIGCPIVPAIPQDRVKTIGGMELIARQGELYFNLHTTGQTFFGDIRGAFYLVEER